ncbi:hypothetical protein [Scytonema sp. UIC 10036]|nr:hypothetical protein [Scytonema sp. UIC 10036]
MPNSQSPIPNPQSPMPNSQSPILVKYFLSKRLTMPLDGDSNE